MSNDTKASLALEALRTAAIHVEALRDECRLSERIGSMLSTPALALVADLVGITKRMPVWNLGHLYAEEFEVVRGRLNATPFLSVHDDGARFLIIEVERAGFVIRAQTYDPTPAGERSAEAHA